MAQTDTQLTRRHLIRIGPALWIAGALGLSVKGVAAQGTKIMTDSPQALQAALATAFNARDLEALAALFHTDGTLVPQPGTLATGDAAIREALNGFLEIPGTMTVETTDVVVSGETALGRTSWKIENDGAVAVAGQGIEVMRQDANGAWRFVIDHPFGGA